MTPTFMYTEAFVKAAKKGEIYPRVGFENLTYLEKRLAELEGAPAAAVFNSGMAAITAVLCFREIPYSWAYSFPLLGPSSSLLLGKQSNIPLGPTNLRNDETFIERASYCENGFYGETVSNPLPMMSEEIEWADQQPMRLLPIRSIIRNVLPYRMIVLDDTMLAGLWKPYEVIPAMGAFKKNTCELVIIRSLTKSYQGGQDLVTGGVVFGSVEFIAELKKIRGMTGGIMQPVVVEVFADQHVFEDPKYNAEYASMNAWQIARTLDELGVQISYVGLRDHPDFESLSEYGLDEHHAGTVLCANFGTAERLAKFADACFRKSDSHNNDWLIGNTFGHHEHSIAPLGCIQSTPSGWCRIGAGFHGFGKDENIQETLNMLRQIVPAL